MSDNPRDKKVYEIPNPFCSASLSLFASSLAVAGSSLVDCNPSPDGLSLGFVANTSLRTGNAPPAGEAISAVDCSETMLILLLPLLPWFRANASAIASPVTGCSVPPPIIAGPRGVSPPASRACCCCRKTWCAGLYPAGGPNVPPIGIRLCSPRRCAQVADEASAASRIVADLPRYDGSFILAASLCTELELEPVSLLLPFEKKDESFFFGRSSATERG